MTVHRDFCAPPCGGMNVIDFPALKWAHKLSHPRIWVTDFGVTGIGDSGGAGNLAMCVAAARKGRFFTVTDTEEALKILKRLGKFYKKK